MEVNNNTNDFFEKEIYLLNSKKNYSYCGSSKQSVDKF